jgi:orotate phosphoribosyltransferase-like protein
MQQTIQLIDKALTKANNDLNNETIEVNYTPDILIELLTELKESLKPKDFYEIKVEWSEVFNKNRLYIYRNDTLMTAYDTLEEAEKILNRLKERKEVSNESAN